MHSACCISSTCQQLPPVPGLFGDENMENQECEKKVTIKVCVDFFLLVLVFLPTPLFFFIGKPFKRGFFCDDESIAHPYKDSTIGDVLLVCLGIGIPFVCVVAAEIFIYRYRRRKGSIACNAPLRNRFRFSKWRVNRCFAEMYINIGMFLFGAAACQSTTDIIKYSVGRLRPHFLAVCKPNWDDFNCTDEHGYMRYVEDYECSGDADVIQEARLSHPSGHASLSAYCMVYLALYIEKNMTWKGSKLLKRTLQIVLLYMSLYTGLSRISDYKHHWSDVLAGFLLGSLVALINAFYISRLFKKPGLTDLPHKLLSLDKLTTPDMSRVCVNADRAALADCAPEDSTHYRRTGSGSHENQPV